MNLIFLRHGQTEWNALGLLQGSTDVPLNEVGLSGARSVRPLLEKQPIVAVYTSPLLRAKQTARAAFPKITPVIDDRLREWSFGVMEGKPYANAAFSDLWKVSRQPAQGAERIEDVIARVFDFYCEIERKHVGETVLCVSHGGVSGALYGALFGIPEEGLYPHCLPNVTPVIFCNGSAPVVLKEE